MCTKELSAFNASLYALTNSVNKEMSKITRKYGDLMKASEKSFGVSRRSTGIHVNMIVDGCAGHLFHPLICHIDQILDLKMDDEAIDSLTEVMVDVLRDELDQLSQNQPSKGKALLEIASECHAEIRRAMKTGAKSCDSAPENNPVLGISAALAN